MCACPVRKGPCLQTVAGIGHCWGYAPYGDECSGVDFTGVTDVFSTANAFLVLNRDTSTTTATTTTTAIAATTTMYLLSFNEDAEEVPHLIMPAAGALALAVGVSVLLGGLARVVTKFKATPDELSLCRFFTLQFLDLSCDILAYVFCFVGPGIRRRWGFDLHITVGFRGRQWGILPHGAFPVVHISRTIPRVESVAVMLTLGR